MKNILILYNPYYQKDVIDQHLKIIQDSGKVAFGKVRSKIKDMQNPSQKELEQIYANTSETNFIQLFLTDYVSLFVAKVVRVTSEDLGHIAPEYYAKKGLDVEQWFVISDIRELVRKDFETIRGSFWANFTTPHNKGHTYAIYGNDYDPLIVNLKQEICYFDDEICHYKDVFKSQNFIKIKENLVKFAFGKTANLMHPDTIQNIISAQMELDENKQNPLYDFSSVATKYSKCVELETYLFIKVLFKFLSQKDHKILDVSYSMQEQKFTAKDIFTNKPNLGACKFLLKQYLVKDLISNYLGKSMLDFTQNKLQNALSDIQDIRNEAVHGKPPKLSEIHQIRNKILGINCVSIVCAIVTAKSLIK